MELYFTYFIHFGVSVTYIYMYVISRIGLVKVGSLNKLKSRVFFFFFYSLKIIHLCIKEKIRFPFFFFSSRPRAGLV